MRPRREVGLQQRRLRARWRWLGLSRPLTRTHPNGGGLISPSVLDGLCERPQRRFYSPLGTVTLLHGCVVCVA